METSSTPVTSKFLPTAAFWELLVPHVLCGLFAYCENNKGCSSTSSYLVCQTWDSIQSRLNEIIVFLQFLYTESIFLPQESVCILHTRPAIEIRDQ